MIEPIRCKAHQVLRRLTAALISHQSDLYWLPVRSLQAVAGDIILDRLIDLLGIDTIIADQDHQPTIGRLIDNERRVPGALFNSQISSPTVTTLIAVAMPV